MSSVAQITPAVNGGLRVAAYLRVSSEEQIEGYSLDAQLSYVRKWAAERNNQIVKVYREEGQSAFRGTRSEFGKLIRDAGRNEFDAVVVHKWDRFGRNREEVIVNKIMLRKKCSVKIFSVTEPGQDDGNSNVGMLIESIMESVNHWYSVNLGTEVAKACLEKHEQGLQLNRAPTGYDMVERRLIINETEALGVIRAFERYSTGQYSYTDIANLLNEMRIKTKTGRRFSKDNVREMLRNPIYIGKVRYQRTSYNPDGSRSYASPISIRDGQHEAILDETQFNKVQEIQKKRKHEKGKSNYKPHLLRGLIYCQRCADSAPDNALPSWSKMYCRQHSGHKTRYVYCDAVNKGHKACGQKGVIADVLEEQVIDLLSHLKPGNDWRKRAIETLAGRISENDVLKRLDELKVIARNMDFRFDRGLIVDIDDYLTQRAGVQEQIDKLEPLLTVSEELEQAASLLNNFKAHFEACGGDLKKQHELIRLIIDRVYVKDEKITRVVFTQDCELVLTGGEYQYVSHKSGRQGT